MFGQIHVYTSYSFQESTILINDLINEAITKGLKALAITDINNMHGVIEFYIKCKKNNIKPLIGMETTLYVSDSKDDVGEPYPFVLLARNTKGYYHLCKISSAIQSGKTISIFDIKNYRDDLYILTPGKMGIIERSIVTNLNEVVSNKIKQFKELFGSSFIFNIHNHHIALANHTNKVMLQLAKTNNIDVVCSNQISYLKKEDAKALTLLNASKKDINLELNFEVETNEKYVKSFDEMSQLFSKEIIENTEKLVNSIDVEISLDQAIIPKYPVPNNGNSEQYLVQLCKLGLQKRFKNQKIEQRYIERLKDELRVISTMGFNDYFLIVYDYVLFAKKSGICVGPGRGSAVGSLVAYVLGITNCDPLKYDLLFERFLNEERISLPDIDVDFQDNRRDEVVNYIKQKYGVDNVAGIVTFNSYGPKNAIKDLGKVLKVPLPKLERLASRIPTDVRKRQTIKQMYQENRSFKIDVDADPYFKIIIEAAMIVEKLPKNISQHAAGIVLSNHELSNMIPTAVSSNGFIVSQYSKDYIETAGLIKMDLLGLKNLSVVDYVLKAIKEYDGTTINLNQIPLDDQKVFEMIAAGDTFGIFQLESDGMKQLLRKMKVSCFEDIVVANAMFRPGPMENIPLYLARKNDNMPYDLYHDDLESILRPTYGIMVYQEQIMQVVQKLAGFSLAKADILRKAITKKEIKLMEPLQKDFIEGAIEKGYSLEVVKKIYDLILKFADYGFNKSHSVAYATLAYQMAYLKVYYPLEFLAALISSESSSTTSKLSLIREANKYGIKVLGPSINTSTSRFEIETLPGGDKVIRFSLTSIKNVGVVAYEAIRLERQNGGPFTDVHNFFERIDTKKVPRDSIESLAKAGAFDDLKWETIVHKNDLIQPSGDFSREFLLKRLDLLIGYGEQKKIENMFDAKHGKSNNTIGVDTISLNERGIEKNVIKRLELEKEVLGLYVSLHPLSYYKLNHNINYVPIYEYGKYIGKKIISMLIIQKYKIIVDKRGRTMCFITFYDEYNSVEATCFSQVFEKYSNILQVGNIYLVEAKVDNRTNISLVVDKLMKMNERGKYEKNNSN